LNRVAEIRESNSSGTQLTSYSYNGAKRPVLADYPDTNVKIKLDLYQGTAGTYAGFDRFGRTINQYWMRYYSGTTDIDCIKYGYDAAGNRTWHEDVVAAANTVNQDDYYTYDGLHRLSIYKRGDLTGAPPTGISGTPTKEEDWTLDQLGNWSGYVQKSTGSTTLNQTRYHNSVNEIDTNNTDSDGPGASITASVGTNWEDPKYDKAGNMTTMPQSAHLNRSYTLTFDAWDRLVKVYDDYKEQDEQTNEYDGLGRRIVSTASGTSHYYYNEFWQLVEERASTSANPRNQFVWHPHYVDALAVCYWDGNTDGSYGGTNEGAHYYCQDANFNVTAIANSSGTVLERYNYTPYGKVTFLNANFTNKSTQSTGIGNMHLYTGRELDAKTGLQLNRHRFYSSSLGRWLTRDPIGYRGYDWNLYEYGLSKPVDRLDASGEQSIYGLYIDCKKALEEGDLDKLCDCYCKVNQLNCETSCKRCKSKTKETGDIRATCYCFCTQFSKKTPQECTNSCGGYTPPAGPGPGPGPPQTPPQTPPKPQPPWTCNNPNPNAPPFEMKCTAEPTLPGLCSCCPYTFGVPWVPCIPVKCSDSMK
jgi:RHS repeat-associated protein